MKYLIVLPLILLAACGGGDPVNQFVSGGTLTGPILYPNDGRSNALFTCNDSALSVQSSIELGMSKPQVRTILGKPRHIVNTGEDWQYGPVNFASNDFYRIPVANFHHLSNLVNTETIDEVDTGTTEVDTGDGNIDFVDRAFVDDFSGDDTLCTASDVPFIEAANSYAQVAGDTDFSNELPTCFDAAVRIAAAVEQGMSLTQVRVLVGKPIEVAVDGTHWRYQFGNVDPQNTPFVYFSQYDITGPYYVIGYSTEIGACE